MLDENSTQERIKPIVQR